MDGFGSKTLNTHPGYGLSPGCGTRVVTIVGVDRPFFVLLAKGTFLAERKSIFLYYMLRIVTNGIWSSKLGNNTPGYYGF